MAKKHRSTIYRRPFSESQLNAFDEAILFVTQNAQEIILDSGCGTGDSTFWLSEKYPSCTIIGVDQSLCRLEKAKAKLASSGRKNIFFVRARLEDFWRLALLAQWPITRHYLLYPNPWPKSEHFARRWHGHPVFSQLLQLSPYLEIRSNWLLYLEEFAVATRVLTNASSTPTLIENPEGVSAFEMKYRAHKSPCYSLKFTHRGC